MKDLLDIGFEPVGAWCVGPKGLELKLDAMAEVAPALYAFAVGEDVRYVGKTLRPLQRRLYGYLRPGDTQLTNVRVRQLIVQALAAGDSVSILAFADEREQRIGRFRLNVPAGLEDDIIRQLRPTWNGRAEGAFTAASGTASPPADSEPKTAPAATHAPEPPRQQPEAPRSTRPTFKVTIGRTYYRQGFFNVPVDFARYFAAHGAELRIRLPGRPMPIHAHINRTVNSNDTPRVMGGAHLRDWFQDRLRLNAPVLVIVHSREEIEIQPA